MVSRVITAGIDDGGRLAAETSRDRGTGTASRVESSQTEESSGTPGAAESMLSILLEVTAGIDEGDTLAAESSRDGGTGTASRVKSSQAEESSDARSS